MSVSQKLSAPSSRPHSRPQSRTRDSHDAPRRVPYLQEGANELLLPEGTVTEEQVELLHEFVHPHFRDKRRAGTEATLVTEEPEHRIRDDGGTTSGSDSNDEDEEDWDTLKRRPWYKRPSPIWLLCTTPFSSIAMSACAAPRIEIYTLLACREHRPEYTVGDCPHGVALGMNSTLPIFIPGLPDTIPIKDFQNPILGFDTILPTGEPSSKTLKELKDTSKCASDPVVQAAAAKIIAVMTTTMGILSCFTTAFWGSLSDRFGRLRVLGISVIGLLFNDLIFITVFFFSRQLPGGYWFLLLGPIIEGILGGLTSMVAAIHAYIADVSSPGDRSRQFSLGAGLLFLGMAFGPSFGSLLVHVTRTPMAVFYLATAVHGLLAVYVWIVAPESLPKSAQKANRRNAARRRLQGDEAEEREARALDEESEWKLRSMRILRRTKGIFSFLSPLSIFAPAEVENAWVRIGKKRRDWSLTFIATSFGFSSFVMASYQYKFQYAAATFGWTSEELGYWLSLVGASRAVYLTLLLPFIIKFFNKPKQPIQLPVESSESLDLFHSEPSSSTFAETSPSSPLYETSASSYNSTSLQRRRPRSPPPPVLAPHTATFDLRLARFSLGWEVICYALIPLAPSAAVFSVFGCIAAWGGGFGPAVQALALETYLRRNVATDDQGSPNVGEINGQRKGNIKEGEAETGRLFGAMSVVQAMCSQIFGPTLFGLTYAATVGTYPTTIFWVSTLCITLALVFMLLVRLPRTANHGVHIPGHVSPSGASDADLENAPGLGMGIGHEDTLVDITDVVDSGKFKTGK